MNFGELLSGAGVVGRAWREEEEAQRRAREQELRTAELNRLDRLRQYMNEAPPVRVPQFPQFFGIGTGILPVIEVPSAASVPTASTAPAAPTASTAPAAPTAPTATPAAPTALTAAPASVTAPVASIAPTVTKPAAVSVTSLAAKPRPYEEIKNLPTDQLTVEEWRALPEAERQRRLQILNNERQTASDRAWLFSLNAAIADRFLGGPYNVIAHGLTQAANAINFARIGRALGIYGPEVTHVEVPKILTGTATPFFDWIRITEQSNRPLTEKDVLEQLKAQDAAYAKQVTQISPTPQLLDMQRLLSAMIQVESAGDSKAVSKKGAVGLMQVLPRTAMKPGFGIPNVFDFAERMGVIVGPRDEAEAKRLLSDPKIGVAYGQLYMDALLKRYNGNLQIALAAYNAGPSHIDKWLAKGADFSKLPGETRGFISKVLTILNSQTSSEAGRPATTATASAPAATASTPAVVTSTPTAVASAPAAGLSIPGISTAQAASLPIAAKPQQEETFSPSQFYLANPHAIPFDMQQIMQQRAELERLANMYQRAGLGFQYMGARAKLMELDNSLIYLHGMQGLRELTIANDPRRLAAVWSQYIGVPVNIQPRTDGKWDILVNGQRTQTGLTSNTITDLARSAFDQAYMQQKVAASAEYNKKAYESLLRMQEEAAKAQYGAQSAYAKEIARMIAQIAIERTKGNMQLAVQIAVEQLKKNGWEVKPTGDGSGNLVFIPPLSSNIFPFIVNTQELMGKSTTNPDRVRVPVSPSRSVPIPAQ